MFSEEGRPGDPSLGGVTGDEFADDAFDASDANYFSAEIEGVDASDWNVDATLIWGEDDGVSFEDIGAEAIGPDFLV